MDADTEKQKAETEAGEKSKTEEKPPKVAMSFGEARAEKKSLKELFLSEYSAKGGEEAFDSALNDMEKFSYAIFSVSPDTLLLISETKPADIEKHVASVMKENVSMAIILKSYAANSMAFDALARALAKDTIIEKNFGTVRSFRDLVKVYYHIFNDKKFIDLLRKIEDDVPELAELLKALDPITLFFFLRMILPVMLASGFSKGIMQRVTGGVIPVLGGRRVVNTRKFLNFLPNLRDFIFSFGTPDGGAVMLFLEGKPWLA